jgi:hypothetical protein
MNKEEERLMNLGFEMGRGLIVVCLVDAHPAKRISLSIIISVQEIGLMPIHK